MLTSLNLKPCASFFQVHWFCCFEMISPIELVISLILCFRPGSYLIFVYRLLFPGFKLTVKFLRFDVVWLLLHRCPFKPELNLLLVLACFTCLDNSRRLPSAVSELLPTPMIPKTCVWSDQPWRYLRHHFESLPSSYGDYSVFNHSRMGDWNPTFTWVCSLFGCQTTLCSSSRPLPASRFRLRRNSCCLNG